MKEKQKNFEDMYFLFKLIKLIENAHKGIKLTFLILTILSFSVTASAQRLSISVNNAKVEQVLSSITQQTGLSVAYSKQIVNLDRRVSINLSEVEVNKVLDKLIEGTNLSYEVKDGKIYLFDKAKGFTNPEVSQQNTRKITGEVNDLLGPIIGANVVEKGTNNGAITNVDGKFTINVSENAVLLISYIGYLSQEITIGNSNNLTVTLQENSQALEEVVVVGYGTTTRKNLTTAISTVKPDNISKAANSNTNQLLLGQAAGLQATVSSAQPGGNVSVSIRGAGTPIYVVDGVVMPSGALEPGTGNLHTPASVDRAGLAGLNPEDIESIEVLKDASAAIYGIGAADGVILITTKRGKEGPLKINYEGSVSSVRNYDYPEPLDAQQYMNYTNIFAKENYLYNNKLAPYGPTEYSGGWSPVYTDQEIAQAQTTHWKDLVLRDGNINNHTLTLSGGSKNIDYYVSGNYFNQKGQMINSDMERFSLKSTIGAKLASFLKLSVGMNLNYNNYTNSAVGANDGGTGNSIAGALASAILYPPNLPIKDELGRYSSFRTANNPVGLSEIDDKTKTYGTYVNFAVDVDIIKNMLSAKLLYGNNLENARRNTYIPSTIYFFQMYSPRGNMAENHIMNQTMEATLMLKKEFFNIVNMDAVIGIGRYLNHADGMNISYQGGQYDAIANDNISSVTGSFLPGSYRRDDEKRSQFLRANFDVLDRYVISGTLRRDGTDKFFPDKKYAWFPSVSLAWKISNESFLKDVSWINLLKLRASYGTTGSDNLGTRLYGTFGPYANFVIFNNNSTRYMPFEKKGLDYPNVTWQKTVMKNIGLDFYLFKDRLSGSFDLFSNDITNMLGTANSAGLSMFGTYPLNGAEMRRQGWDATLQSKNVIDKDFSWSTMLTLSKYKSEWIERMPNYAYNLYEKQGRVTTNAWYYYKTNGIINADKSNMPATQPASAQTPGYPILVDKDGDGEITVADVELTDNTPKLYLGLGNTFKYKNLDLSIFIYSKVGVYKYNYALDWADASSLVTQSGNTNVYTDRLWNSQTNPNGTLPGIAPVLESVTLPGGAGTDMRFQDASFVRVRNITLGYNFKGSALGEAGKVINTIRIYLDVQNPFTFTRFEGFDPEVNIGFGGSSKGELPQARIYSAGINLSF